MFSFYIANSFILSVCRKNLTCKVSICLPIRAVKLYY